MSDGQIMLAVLAVLALLLWRWFWFTNRVVWLLEQMEKRSHREGDP